MTSYNLEQQFLMGVDVGGTFTDLVAASLTDGQIYTLKTHSVPSSPGKGVIQAIHEFLNFHPGNISSLIHASTIGTNLFLGQLGLNRPKIVLVTTEGFSDIIELGRQKRVELYNPYFQKPLPLVERAMRFSLPERIDYQGQVIRSLNQKDLESLADKIQRSKPDVIAVTFLHSYRNNIHEKMVQEYFQTVMPDIPVIISSQVDPEYREYERTSTTVLNALLTPVITRYLESIRDGLMRKKIHCPIQIMQSSGGLASFDHAVKLPVAAIESGPATGVTAAADLGRIMKLDKLLCFDMGGTTAKAGAVVDNRPQMIREYEVGGAVHSGRMIKGSGYPVRYPFIDLAEISAGGGTIAYIDGEGLLKVGPVSAGADPGPACYKKGGEQPTITDANLVLGRLNPGGLGGGTVPLSLQSACKAFETKLLPATGMTLEECALGIIRIVNQEMIRALRLVSLERGFDPREFILLAYGGGGPGHAAAIAEGFGIPSVIIPPNPGVFSAMGLLTADFRKDFKFCILQDSSQTEKSDLDCYFAELQESAGNEFRQENFTDKNIRFEKTVEMRYSGQSFEITIPWKGNIGKLESDFHRKHQQVYGYAAADDPVELVNLTITAFGLRQKPEIFNKANNQVQYTNLEEEYRHIYFKNTGWIKSSIFQRDNLPAGYSMTGPVIIEQYDSTTLIPPGWQCRIDELKNIRLTRRNIHND